MVISTINTESELLKLCQKFIKDHNISCAEHIYQSDEVIVNAYEFITDICEIVGYVKYDEDNN